jgi:hypothetical protein
MVSKDASNSAQLEEENASDCPHHWVIEPAHGSVSEGVCQICQEVREFKNSIGWEYGQRKPGRPASS